MTDFTLKQTTMPETKYDSQTLLGNWFEERCDPSSKNSTRYSERKYNVLEPYKKDILTKETFNTSSANWMTFQKTKPNDTFQSITMQEFKKPQEQTRHSVVNKFFTKKGFYDNKQEELEAYRARWSKTKLPDTRTYLGVEKKI